MPAAVRSISVAPALRVYFAAMRRELVITHEDQERAIAIEPRAEGRWRVVVDGQEHLVDARRVRPGTWSLLVEGRSFVVDLDDRKLGTAILIGEVEAVVTVEDARRKRLAQRMARPDAIAGTGERLQAPIAGKVVKILVAPGDQVEAGHSVAVLEAMKMENEIKAERGGTVTDIHVQAGQSVDTGDLLITLT